MGNVGQEDMSRLATVVVIIALTTIPALGELCADAKHTTCLQPTGDIVSKGPCRSDSEVLPGANAPYAADNSGAVGGSLSVPLTIPEPAGIARISEPVTVGVPLSREANITDVARLGIFDADTELPAQFRVLSRWDGPPDAVLPIRWVLADFQFDTGAGQLQTVFLRNTGSGNGSSQLSIDVSDPSVAVIDTGSMEVILSRTRGNLFERVSVGGQVVAEDTTAQRDRSGVTLVDGDGTVYRAALTANPEFVVEEQGPMRITIRITSDLTAADGTVLHPGDVQVMHRIHFYANQSFVRMHIQLENNATYGSFDWDNNSPDPDNVLDFDSLVLDVPLQVSGQRFLQADGYQDTGSDSDTWRVYQGHTINDPMDESQNFFYEVSKNGVPVSTGDRYPGWIDISTSNGGTTAGVRWFWQNWEKALSVTGDRLSVELWPAEGFYPLDRMPANLYQFEGGRHKSYEVLLLFHDSAGGEPGTIMGRFEAPLIARAPPRWYYQTQALGLTDPGDLVFSGTDDDVRMNVAYQRYNDLMRKRADGIAPDEGREWPRNIIEAKEMRFVYGWYDPCCWSSVDWYGWAIALFGTLPSRTFARPPNGVRSGESIQTGSSHRSPFTKRPITDCSPSAPGRPPATTGFAGWYSTTG